MNRILWWKQLCECLGGEQDAPPAGVPLGGDSWLWGLWWAALATIVAIFCGQSSKFIYIDF